MADRTIDEILNFVEENDVKFIRLAFCDIFGNQKNISIMPCELEKAFTTGINFDSFWFWATTIRCTRTCSCFRIPPPQYSPLASSAGKGSALLLRCGSGGWDALSL